MFAVPEGPSEAKIPITVRRIHLIRRPYAKRRGRRETMFDCPLSKTVKILDQRSCSIVARAGSTAVAPGDHVVSPFAATCRAPALVLQREARTHASGDSSYLDLLSTAFFGSSRCRELSNPDLTSPAMSSD